VRDLVGDEPLRLVHQARHGYRASSFFFLALLLCCGSWVDGGAGEGMMIEA
jgi:hypothetical protein